MLSSADLGVIVGDALTSVHAQRVAEAVSEVESLLERSVKFYPRDLPPFHCDRLTGRKPEFHRRDPHDLLRLHFEPDDSTASLQKHLEVCRAHAEALLVHERLGHLILSADERETLTRCGLGIMPASEKDRFQLVLACPGLAPHDAEHGASSHHTATPYRSVPTLIAAVRVLSQEISPATGLAFGMLVLGGMRTAEQLLHYAGRLDSLFDRVVRSPHAIQALDSTLRPSAPLPGNGAGTAVDAGVELQPLFRVLVAVRDQLWSLKPSRVSTAFLLPQVVDNYLGPEQGVGNSLGLAAIDSIIVGRLGFPVHFKIDSGVLSLEVLVSSQSVYWDVVRPSPLSFVPVLAGRRVEIDELIALVLSSQATNHFSRGRVERAIKVYNRVLEIMPDSTPTLVSLGACFLKAQMPKQALESLDRAIRTSCNENEVESAVGRRNLAEAHYYQGNAHASMQNWSRAVASYKQAIALNPDYVEAYNNLGFAFQRSGSAEQAIAALEAAVEIRPDYVQALFNLGNIHLELKQHDEAIRRYREATRLQPNMAQVHYNLGQALYQKGELDRAITAYRRTVQIDPKHFGAWHNLGIAYRDKGLTDKAVEALEKAIQINPNLMR